MWKKIWEKIDREELKRASSILVFVAGVAILIFAFQLGMTAVLLSFPIIAVNLWITWKGTLKYKGMAFGTILIGFALYYFFSSGYFDWGISEKITSAPKSEIGVIVTETADGAGEKVLKKQKEVLFNTIDVTLEGVNDINGLQNAASGIVVAVSQATKITSAVFESTGKLEDAAIAPKKIKNASSEGWILAQVWPKSDSPIWYRLVWPGGALLLIGLLTGIYYSLAKNKGWEIVGSKLTPVGFALVLVAYLIYTSLLPEVNRGTADAALEGAQSGKIYYQAAARMFEWPDKFLIFGLLLAVSFGLWAALRKQGGAVKFAAGTGVLMVIISLFLILFPGAREKLEKVEISLPKVEMSIPSFSRSAEGAESLSRQGMSKRQEERVLVEYGLSSEKWTPWIDTTRWKYWRFSVTGQTEVEFKGDQKIYPINTDGVDEFGVKLGIFRFRGDGIITVYVS